MVAIISNFSTISYLTHTKKSDRNADPDDPAGKYVDPAGKYVDPDDPAGKCDDPEPKFHVSVRLR